MNTPISSKYLYAEIENLDPAQDRYNIGGIISRATLRAFAYRAFQRHAEIKQAYVRRQSFLAATSGTSPSTAEVSQ